MSQLHQVRLSLDIEQDLRTEYNRLKNGPHQRAMDVIIRCAIILEEHVVLRKPTNEDEPEEGPQPIIKVDNATSEQFFG